MTHATSPFHQLHLLLVGLHDTTVGVGLSFVADDETVRQRGYLEVVADTSHGTSLGNNIPKVLQDLKNLVFCKRIRILPFNARHLPGDTTVHIVGCQFIKVPIAILQCVFVGPHVGCQRVAMEILTCGGLDFFIGIYLALHNHLHMLLLRQLIFGETAVLTSFQLLVMPRWNHLLHLFQLQLAKQRLLRFQ